MSAVIGDRSIPVRLLGSLYSLLGIPGNHPSYAFQSDMFFCSGTLRKHGSHILFALIIQPIPGLYFQCVRSVIAYVTHSLGP